MKHSASLKNAVEIARIITIGQRKLGMTAVKDLSLFAMLPLLTLKENVSDINTLDPRINEILLFGSVARGEGEVGDIDLMVFDGGFYSNFFLSRGEDEKKDAYGCLRGNLELLLTGWFDLNADDPDVVTALKHPVDLHVLPISILTSRAKRGEVGRMHKDPKFFQHAFAHVLRYDERTNAFVRIDIADLEKKYKRDLSDLRS
ncbi:MAG: nucleotidyltransferase domain-containing protein [bacterium]|nr:nucleotidyltransferase domain-containing protein [bacterium]